MKLCFPDWLLVAVLAVIAAGCEPRPVVVDPADGDTTIIEEDADRVTPPGTTSRTPGTDVDVRVGEEGGVDVNVAPGGSDSNQGADQRSTSNGTP
jgi:hypothetical protein